ncbi:hypothetical protein [Acinetobacter rudis]|uniref:hypothetical protein n=1 Tax=Acinetobacter rudis TaxID=632955 RepID=UPI00333FA437
MSQSLQKISIVDLPDNGGIQSDGTFPITAKQEIENLFNAGQAYPEENIPYLNYSIAGQCLFALPTHEHTSWSYVPVEKNGDYWSIPLVYQRAFTHHSPLDLGLFTPVEVTESGIIKFKFNGLTPLYTIMNGSLVFHRRVSSTQSTNVKYRITLSLNATNLPKMELGQSNGRQFLGLSSASLKPTPEQLIALEYSGELSANGVNPLDGYWVEEVIAINQDVVFYPGAIYSVDLLSRSYGAGSEAIQPHTFRFISGGLSFNFDATNLVRSKLSKYIQE